MSRYSHSRSFAPAAVLLAAPLLLGTSACKSGSVRGLKSADIVRVDNLGAQIEAVHVESEISKQRLRDAIEAVRAIASYDFVGDPAVAFNDFVTAVEASVEQAETLRDAILPMEESGGAFFDQWNDDLDSFSSVEMRNRSRERLLATHKRFRVIMAAVVPAQRGFDEVNKRLQDYASFLSNDFNATAIAAIEGDVRVLRSKAAKVDQRFDACMRATSAYLEATALPNAPEPAANARTGR